MPEENEGTTLEQEQEITQQDESAEGTTSQQESEASETESQTVDWEKRYRDQQAALTKAQQEAAETRRLNEQWAQWGQQQQYAQQQADPVKSLNQRRREALEIGDYDAAQKAEEELFEQRFRQIESNAVAKAAQAADVTRKIRELGKFGVGSEQEVANDLNRWTANDKLEAYAYWKAAKSGKLADVVTADQRAAEERSRRAEQSQRGLFSESGGRGVPGAHAEDGAPIEIPHHMAVGIPESALKKKFGDNYKIVP